MQINIISHSWGDAAKVKKDDTIENSASVAIDWWVGAQPGANSKPSRLEPGHSAAMKSDGMLWVRLADTCMLTLSSA